jgi:acyl-[acyl-carrier-protein]-phospholipid O-acyltransferase/long-chain-fatty-acid--[acyl-carrier-protein] ligase
MHEDYYNILLLKWFWRAVKIICVKPSNSRNALKNVINELENKQIVGIFPEGEISRTGSLLQFKRGFEKILLDTRADVTVVPFIVENMWGSLLSKAPKEVKHLQRFLCRREVHIQFGKDLGKNADRNSLEEAMREMLN